MLTRNDLTSIVKTCGIVAQKLGWNKEGISQLESLQIDFVTSANNFIGIHSNPAIFINKNTFKLLGKFHKNWVENKTIAVQEKFLEQRPVKVLGIIIHEAGHAFSVGANMPNNEANAYIFEIEVLTYLFKNKHPLMAVYSKKDLQSYFEARLPDYGHAPNPHLARLIQEIKDDVLLENGQAQSFKPTLGYR